MDRRLDQMSPGDLFPVLSEAALVDRRMALKLMAASAALAAASACTAGPEKGEEIAGAGDYNFVDLPTTLDHDGYGFGIVARTIAGNPVKLEGNPLHPVSLGRSTVFAQAALLSHYDPERLRQPVIIGQPKSWADVRALLGSLRNGAAERQGEGLHILLEPTASPTLERMVGAVRTALPAAHLYGHRAVPLAAEPPPDLSGDVILAIGADFLGPGPAQVLNGERFMAARRGWIARGRVPRLIVAEALPTLTGARADRRLALDPVGMADLADTLAIGGGNPTVREIVALLRAAEQPVVLVGDDAPPYVRQRLVAAGLIGSSAAGAGALPLEPVEALARSLGTGAVDTLVILGGNPLYDVPRGLGLEPLLDRARAAIFVGPEQNETALACGTRLPGAGLLTGWGDLRAVDGTVSLVRPVAGRFGLTPVEILAVFAGEPADAEALVRRTHGLGGDLAALPGGIVLPAGAAPPPQPRPAVPVARPARRELTLLLRPGHNVGGGALAGNAWAQELPDPVTGLAWGNAATLAPVTAERLGIADGDMVEIAVDGAAVMAPALLLAGQAPDTIGLTLGYGRRAGAVGSGVGVDAYPLSGAGPILPNATLRPLGGGKGRLIFPNAPFRPVEEHAIRWVAPGATVERKPDGPSFVTPDRRAAKQWGMVIDLEACIGCNACTIACQAENNVPVVGPDEVEQGRVMHWIRVDRHDSAERARGTAYQPIPCMHCETAPCEPVCPVAATTHSSEGLNQMTYQRCIGTRSCSNNCPYKVRRFNWFDYQQRDLSRPAPSENPRVTVRDAGVMEKCTYCVQRIEAARLEGDGRPPQTACQQACPTQAILFGDIGDPADPVARARASPRNYALLDGNNLMPRTTYLAKIRGGDRG